MRFVIPLDKLSICPKCKQRTFFKKTFTYRHSNQYRPLEKKPYRYLKLECLNHNCNFFVSAEEGITPLNLLI